MIAFAAGFVLGFIACALLMRPAVHTMREVTASMRSTCADVVISKGGVNREYQITDRPPSPPPIPSAGTPYRKGN